MNQAVNADFPPPETPGLSEDVVVVVLMVAATAAAEAACIDDMPSIGNDVSEEKCEEFMPLANVCGVVGLSSGILITLPTEEGGGDDDKEAPTVP